MSDSVAEAGDRLIAAMESATNDDDSQELTRESTREMGIMTRNRRARLHTEKMAILIYYVSSIVGTQDNFSWKKKSISWGC